MLHRVLALLLVLATLVAQTRSAGSINGVVRDAGTGDPLADVHVSLAGDQAVTDSKGRFRFEAVEPGIKRLWASDKTRGAGSGISVLVRAGEEAGAEIRLNLGGVITGRVLDFAGQPIASAVVMLLERRYRYGELVYSPGQSVVSNESGEYRLTGVPPGHALRLLAKRVLKAVPADEFPPYEERETVLLPELYPETVMLTSGETREHIEIRMAESPAYCIEGSFEVSGAKQIFVSFNERLFFDSGWSLTPATIKASAEGRFRACGLHTGAYRITAATAPPGSSLTDRFAGDAAAVATGEAVITGQDIRDLKLFAAATGAVTGDASFDRPPNEKPRRIQITLTRSINGGEGYADSTDKPVSFAMYGALSVGGGTDVPGPFSLGRRYSGDWDLRVSRLPTGCYVKQAAYGTRDLAHAPLHIGEAGPAERVRLVIGCDGGSINARVTDKDGNPVPNAVLYVFDANADNPGDVAATLFRADIAGGWSSPITALRPGKYLALVTDLDISPPAAPADEIEELWRAKGHAKEVEIGPGAVVQLSVTYDGATFR